MDLREYLDTIMHSDNGNNWWKPDLFQKKTLVLIPPELTILAAPPSEKNNYNCFIHVLGLSEDRDVLQDSKGFIYDTFFQKLIDEKLLSYTDNPQNGDYILYRDSKKYPGIITHIGIKDNDKVISKWAWGPLVRHAVLNVPESYGSEISFISAIPKNQVKKYYLQYKDFNRI